MTMTLTESNEVATLQHLYFPNTKKLQELALRTLKAKKFKTAYEKKYTSDKSVFLVKDEGIYLMNCYKQDTEFLKKDFVVYARGYNVNTIDRNIVWDKANKISRDDFAENIPFSTQLIINILEGLDLHVYISEQEIRVCSFGGK